eukprot:scaffold4898_cov129-Isochrysis_galbana.AAC.4
MERVDRCAGTARARRACRICLRANQYFSPGARARAAPRGARLRVQCLLISDKSYTAGVGTMTSVRRSQGLETPSSRADSDW